MTCNVVRVLEIHIKNTLQQIEPNLQNPFVLFAIVSESKAREKCHKIPLHVYIEFDSHENATKLRNSFDECLTFASRTLKTNNVTRFRNILT